MRRLALLAAVAAAASAGIAGGASAAGSGKLKPDFQRVSSSFGPMAQGVREGLVCGGEKSVLSGGIDLETGFGNMLSVGYYPYDADADSVFDGYRAIGDNISSSNIFMGATSVCAKVKDMAQRGDAQTSPAFQRKSLKATCANNEHVTGGGGFGDGPFGAQRLAESAPYDDGDQGSAPDDGWRITIDNVSGTNYTATAYAHCAKQLGGLTYLHKDGKAKPGAEYEKTVRCRQGLKAIGGGLETESAGGVGVITTTRHALGPEDQWDTALANDAIGKVPVTSHAICHR